MSATERENEIRADVLILGGGPSGISCALECADSGLDHLLLERSQKFGGQLDEIPGPIPNLPAGNYHASGKDLSFAMLEHARSFGCSLEAGVDILEADLEKLSLRSKNTLYRGRTIYIAAGARYREPTFENQARFKEYIHHRHYVDNHHFEGRDVIIVGGGDSAFFAALAKANVAKSVTILHRSSNFKVREDIRNLVQSDPRIEILPNYEIISLEGRKRLEAVILKNNTSSEEHRRKADVVYAKLGYVPNSELFYNQLEITDSGHIKTDEKLRTSKAGVFAGGDIVSPGYDRFAVALGHGSLAVKFIRRYLTENQA
ncbi:MAG TPA: NAD(P)/FAD-dependent oxidoreductase [Candidatus Melainabacteria bacterium]|nr:NAD(P)/FAD-dependent oxidoreductase [Candidatus Melainabacteria bacterium]